MLCCLPKQPLDLKCAKRDSGVPCFCYSVGRTWNRAAQRFMINRALEWAGVEEGGNAPKTGVDIGKSFSSIGHFQ